MGLLNDFKERCQGVCATCDHLIRLDNRNSMGCEVHDKFILPEFPPYHNNCKCPDWKERKISMDLTDISRMSAAAQRQILDKLGKQQQKTNKYHNKPTAAGNLKFQSKHEADCYRELILLQRAGKIRKLKVQPEYTLQEAYTDPDTGERIRAIRYKADFSYERETKPDATGSTYWIPVVVDAKSPATRTRVYLNKRKMMQEHFGITIVEV